MNPRELVTRGAAEVVTLEDLDRVLQKPQRKAYIGFEPSGKAHLGWKVCANKVRDLQDAGFEVTILLADWHAMINDKLGGDIERIRLCGQYMEAVMLALGVREGVKFVYASDLVDNADYWEMVIRVGKGTTLNRIRRAMTIMGRREDEAELDYAKTLYPAMQVADIFHLGVDLAYGGLDQRHAHMLARDVAPKIGRTAPVALHTPLLPSLQEDGGRMDPVAGKMSKSRPESGIFLHDTPAEVEAKLKQAFCPAQQVENNPVLSIVQHVIFPELGSFAVDRPAKFGGPLAFSTYDDLAKAYAAGLHPLDVKTAAAAAVNRILEGVRAYFQKHPSGLQALERALAP